MATAATPPPLGYESDLDNPKDVIRTINFVTQALTLTFCTLFVWIRAYHKFRTVGLDLAVDDYLTFVSWILMTGYCIAGFILSIHGGGYHMWDISALTAEKFLQAAYTATVFYAPMTLAIKLSLLTLITRIFSPFKRRIQGIYVLGGLLVVYYIVSLILKVRICWPIAAYWQGDQSKCLNQSAVITADSIISTVTDAIILVLPLPLTWSLQLPTTKKLRVGGMLAVGGLATAFSGWRLNLILTHGKSQDMTVLFVQIVMSGNAEAGIALICTCLPAFVAQFNILKDRVGYGSSRGTDARYEASGPHKLSTFRSGHLGTGKSKRSGGFETWSDEAELVTQVKSSLEGEPAQSGGIVRRVEVTHTVTYAASNSDDGKKSLV
ncbi:uncharacterized protein EKO05_0000884 [Ascochyta rabiei]|uniref:uncharacterized protein n=1 Tax=Didymella rabiei TaxID=5454 RepID=UPI0018FFEF47|nr:uncharacterized protein EKO05_0000884 [Ascochyta rabiei]UPX10214.1 hypothetical protein EKO05_0000884 [Ascochyta rabiei]